MYHALIIAAVVMFSGTFALNDIYRRMRGSGIKTALEASFVGSLAGLAVLVLLSGFKPEFTPFTFLMASLAALNGFGFTYCSFKALGSIDLSLFSLFSMLGGMALPFAQGILFYGEPITLAKLVCVAFICAALLLTVSVRENKNGTIYYIGIFTLNGMSGVISKIFSSSPLPKTSATGYSVLLALITAVTSGVILLVFFRKRGKNEPPYSFRACAVCASYGAVNKVANLLLIIALAHVDASVQYPMVTGGVMIASTLICFLGEQKPTKKEIISVILAFIGMLALFAIPI